MENKTARLSTWEAACIITGYGIGGGVLAMPYLASKNGLPMAGLILLLAFGASYVLHMMIAELSVKSGNSSQIIEVFSKLTFSSQSTIYQTSKLTDLTSQTSNLSSNR